MVHSPIITLSNDKKVANFSSSHIFEFADGSILPAIDKKLCKMLEVTFIETVINEKNDVRLTFKISDLVRVYMADWIKEYEIGNVDVVFCPLPMITALHEEEYDVEDSPFRSIRRVNRMEQLVSIDKQCI